MKKTSGTARQCAAAVGLAVLLGTACPMAYADGGEDDVVVAVIPVPAPTEETPAPPVETPTLPEETPAPSEEPPAPPIETTPTPPAETTPVTVPEDTTPVTVPDSLQEPQPAAPAESEALFPPLIADDSANANEAVPASDEPTPTAAPSITSEPSAAAAPVALPEPVTKTIDAVVATATGSPLYVQVVTVLALIGAGVAYFRVLGSKRPRRPSKSVK